MKRHQSPELLAQIAEGRRLAAAERETVDPMILDADSAPRKNTLSLPSRPTIVKELPVEAPQSSSVKREQKKKAKAAPSGHEALLEKLRAAGSYVRIRLLDNPDELIAGVVMHWDKYTISLQISKVVTPQGVVKTYKVGETAVFYKHALTSFTPMLAVEKSDE